MAFCLIKPLADEFLRRIKSGEITPEKLSDMTSAERHKYFSDFMGEDNAKQVNGLFESKLLLKSQQTGMINWAKQTAGLKPEVRRDLITRIEKMDKILNPAEESAFLQDLASKKLGTDVTYEEAQKITELSKDIKEKRQGVENGTISARDYGKSKIKMDEYLNELMPTKNSVITGLANIPRTVQTMGDMGWTFRQGWGMQSRPEFYSGLYNAFGYMFSKEHLLNLKADIVADKDYELVKGKLRLPSLTEKLSGKEEEWMNQFTGKVPGLKQIERANAGQATYVRWMVTKKLLEAARLRGEDIRKGSQAVTDIINSVNNFSGSGNIGKGDKYANLAPILNPIIYSTRGISAKINIMDPRNYFDPRISLTARKANMRNLLGSTAMTVALLGLAHQMGAKTETDSKSSNFGKAVWDKLHVDLTGGNAGYLTLVRRIISNQTKIGDTVKSLDEGYKPNKRGGTMADFIRNKLAPLASGVADWLFGPVPYQESTISQKLFGPMPKGAPFELKREVINKTTPMIVDTILSLLNDPNHSKATLGILIDFFGNSTSNY